MVLSIIAGALVLVPGLAIGATRPTYGVPLVFVALFAIGAGLRARRTPRRAGVYQIVCAVFLLPLLPLTATVSTSFAFVVALPLVLLIVAACLAFATPARHSPRAAGATRGRGRRGG